jgi:hypothetical protein
MLEMDLSMRKLKLSEIHWKGWLMWNSSCLDWLKFMLEHRVWLVGPVFLSWTQAKSYNWLCYSVLESSYNAIGNDLETTEIHYSASFFIDSNNSWNKSIYNYRNYQTVFQYIYNQHIIFSNHLTLHFILNLSQQVFPFYFSITFRFLITLPQSLFYLSTPVILFHWAKVSRIIGTP